MLLPTLTFAGSSQQSLRDLQDVALEMIRWIVAEQQHLTGFGTGPIIIDILWRPRYSFVVSFTRGLPVVAWLLWASVLLRMSFIKDLT
jgi:hypothetical protein